MAHSIITYPGNGTTGPFAVNFTLGYISTDHVTAWVVGEVDAEGAQLYRELTWINAASVSVSGAAVAVGETLKISRDTPVNALLHNYQDGGVLDETSLDESNLQNIMLAQEALDGKRVFELYEDMDAAGYTITNLGSLEVPAPLTPESAVPRSFVDSGLTEYAEATKVAVASDAAAAAASAAAALVSEGAAADSATAALVSEGAAEAAMTAIQLMYVMSATQPDPVQPDGALWVDTSTSPRTVYVSNGTSYTIVGNGGDADTLNGVAVGGIVSLNYATLADLTTASGYILVDDSIPQITEGTEVLALAVTPLKSTNKLHIKVDLFGHCSNTGIPWVAALFKDSGAAAIYAKSTGGSNSASPGHLEFDFYVVAGSTDARTYKVRVGAGSNASAYYVYMNGSSSGTRVFGGVSLCSISITEYNA